MTTPEDNRLDNEIIDLLQSKLSTQRQEYRDNTNRAYGGGLAIAFIITVIVIFVMSSTSLVATIAVILFGGAGIALVFLGIIGYVVEAKVAHQRELEFQAELNQLQRDQ